ncbi:MAG: hypothetical protein M1570_01790 [Chloroflexi bacterium]|nr:hypothetical protein [Chloroflexota bacterium]
MADEEKPIDPEKPEQMIDDIVSRLDGMHDIMVDGATQIGYTRDAFRAVRSTWASLGSASTSSPESENIYNSGIKFLSAFRDEVRAREQQLRPISGLSQQLSGSANSFVTATNSTAGFVFTPGGTSPSFGPIRLTLPGKQESYAGRFSRFDPALGKTYQEIWETLYGTRADPERAALYLIRQAFDQLFEKLAPDDDVRYSPYWTPTTDKGKENQVWREERIRYAAAKHVKDSVRANTLVASVKHMIDVYQGLNRAHVRGELDRDKSRQALAEMRTILEDWANALEI